MATVAASEVRDEEAVTPDFAADLPTSFYDVPFMEQFDEAARSGFEAVDLALPYGIPPQILARRLRDTGLTLVALDLPSGSVEDGGGVACDPECAPEFREGVLRAIDYAVQLGCRLLNCTPGEPPSTISAAAARKTLIENLQFAAQQAMTAGIRILLEAVNAHTLPRGPVHGTAQAIAALDAVHARNISLLYNVSSMRSGGESVEASIMRHLTRVGHVRITQSDDNERMGMKNCYEFYEFIEGIGHQGWIGCGSAESIEASLKWMARDHSPRMPRRWGMPLAAFRKPG